MAHIADLNAFDLYGLTRLTIRVRWTHKKQENIPSSY